MFVRKEIESVNGMQLASARAREGREKKSEGKFKIVNFKNQLSLRSTTAD